MHYLIPFFFFFLLLFYSIFPSSSSSSRPSSSAWYQGLFSLILLLICAPLCVWMHLRNWSKVFSFFSLSHPILLPNKQSSRRRRWDSHTELHRHSHKKEAYHVQEQQFFPPRLWASAFFSIFLKPVFKTAGAKKERKKERKKRTASTHIHKHIQRDTHPFV